MSWETKDGKEKEKITSGKMPPPPGVLILIYLSNVCPRYSLNISPYDRTDPHAYDKDIKYENIRLDTNQRLLLWTVKTQTLRRIEKKRGKSEAEVNGPPGQLYAVAKQPGDSSKKLLHGRFPGLREGIYSPVCWSAPMCNCVCVWSWVWVCPIS